MNDAEKIRRKDLGNFLGVFHSGLASHFRAGGSNYSKEAYDPLSAFNPGHMWVWIKHVARFWFHKKHEFQDYSAPGKGNGIYKMDDEARVSVVGDWGTGTDEAHMVAKCVENFYPEFSIHLGDVYYVGDECEVRENVLGEKTSPYEPVKWRMGEKGSFALCGNHEMYARGSGYFRAVLPKMGLRAAGSEWGSGQGASFFCLENAHWRIIAVDTAYDSTAFDWGRVPIIKNWKWLRKSERFKPKCALPEKVLAWLRSTVNPEGDKRGIIVLSHHGAFSSFGEWYRTPARQLAQIVHRPVIWFWGHEHKFAIYDKFAVLGGIETYGRCIGHGGMPVERGSDPDIDECRWLAWDNRKYDNGEPIDAGYNGHVNLAFDGPALRVEYRDVNDTLVMTEDWRVDLQTGALQGPNLTKILQDDALHFRSPVAHP